MKRRLEIARAMIGWPQIMLYDEPTMSLDPIMAIQVLDLVIRARDINQISSLYVTKKVYEIPHLANFYASKAVNGEVVILEASSAKLPKTRVIVLDKGRIVFAGTLAEFQKTDLAVVKELLALDHHDHSKDIYLTDPWDKRRRAIEEIP
jgi:ABC-type transporter Mla maintaining outer membrane lipid asymmetry ATPase subunit MlaF